MDYYSVQNLLSPEKTWFWLYAERVSADLGAFEYIVSKKIPLAPLGKVPFLVLIVTQTSFSADGQA
jgi:hypothetical protein